MAKKDEVKEIKNNEPIVDEQKGKTEKNTSKGKTEKNTSKGKTYTEAEVKAILAKQEAERIEAEKNKKYKICIPVSEINPQDKFVTVGVNEMYATIERGVETEVELAVYEQLKNAGLI